MSPFVGQPELTLVIPAYREAKRIGKTLDTLAVFLEGDPYFADKHVEVIVVSADAPDNTHEIVEQKSKLFRDFNFIKPGPRVGKGRDVKAGVLAARGKAVLFMDADLATPLRHVQPFYEAFLHGAEVVVGTRAMHRYGQSPLRILVSTLGNIMYQIAGGVWIEDSQCGFKLFSERAAKVCFGKLKILGWGFDMEIITAAKANHFPIKKIHIDDWQAVPNGTFDDKVLKNSFRSLGELGLIFCRRLTGYYRRPSANITTGKI